MGEIVGSGVGDMNRNVDTNVSAQKSDLDVATTAQLCHEPR